MADWLNREPTHDSPYYPFMKVATADTLAGAEELPYIMTRYLMDLPDATGYTPPSDNRFPRARLKKLLYWDCPRPLDKPLPTPEQIYGILYDPENPDRPPDTDRGYRIFPQNMTQQSMAWTGSLVRCYLGDAYILSNDRNYITRQDVGFDILVNVGIEGNIGTTSASRAYSILQCIKEATAGVNFGGVGALTPRRITKIDDERTFLGYKYYAYIDWQSDGEHPNFVLR